MSSKILYYPYINVPKSSWTLTSVLYWDEVGIITPPSYIDTPEQFQVFTRNLVHSGLVKQVFPERSNLNQNGFDKLVLEKLSSSQTQLNEKRNSFLSNNHGKIHEQKFSSELFYSLEKLGLSERGNGGWYNVESSTANLIMIYLATALGISENYTPATDHSFYINQGLTNHLPSKEELSTRKLLLEAILPIPNKADVKTLQKFKEKHKEDLIAFRQATELIISNVSKIENLENRKSELKKNIASIEERKEKLSRKLNESFFSKISNASISSLKIPSALALAFMSFKPIIGGAIGASIASTKAIVKNPIKDEDFAYLAFLDNLK